MSAGMPARVRLAQNAFLDACAIFDSLPGEVRDEIGRFIEAANDGTRSPGGCIAEGFNRWLASAELN